MARKHPRIFRSCAPKIDWLHIIWKCKKHYEWPSAAEAFATDQCYDFALQQTYEAYKRHYSGSTGHKQPHKRVHAQYLQPPVDLRCDDPLYDGEIIR